MREAGDRERGRNLPVAALAVLLAAFLVQLIVGALTPLDGDETLYWEWARHPAWGYFDHPPGIAFLIRAGIGLLGVSALGVRAMAAVANLGGAIMVVVLARRHGGDRAALPAALIISCMPIMTIWLLLATPDTALYLMAMGVLLLVDNALQEPRGSRASFRWWILAGIALGVAALAKELAILLPLGLVAACLTHRELRPRLAEPGPYVAALAAVVLIIPLMLWNRDHDWVLLQFVLHRGLGVEGGSAIGRELEFLGGQAAMASPFLFALLVIAVTRTLRGHAGPRRHVLAVIAAVAFGWFAAAALRHRVEVNWAMMAYPPAAILLAASAGGERPRRWLNVSIGLGGGIVLVLYLHLLFGILPIDPLRDPVRRGRGWDQVAARVDSARIAMEDARRTWVAGNRFQDASQLAFHLDGHPFVFSLNIWSRANQYDFWPGFTARARHGDALILVLDDVVEDSLAHFLSPFFGRVRPGERVVAGGAAPVLAPKRIWILEDWRGGWPAVQTP